MKKLTAEKCSQLLDSLNSNGMSILEGYYCEALEIALPILEQQERGEGWIDWRGGECPVDCSEIKVTIKLRGGRLITSDCALGWDWGRRSNDSDSDIIAYRIIPEQPTNQNGEQ
ncbi:hypothetical protein WKG92_07250 [Pantoea agglomerans]|uniref:hypothetical protein n=1 Tax=Enterobacter agglomerans TaxID=549 RepID=UPI003C7A120D